MKTLQIKNMVCNRCIKVVNDELIRQGLNISHIELGKVELSEDISLQHLEAVREELKRSGFELLDDKKSKLIDRIKTLIINKVHYTSENDNKTENISDHISKELGMDYNYLSNLFSSVEGVTIEKYLILQKIELAKELLVYDELTISEITFKMGYSSVAHLSAQFKKETGLTPSQFKKLQSSTRRPIDEVAKKDINDFKNSIKDKDSRVNKFVKKIKL